MDEIQSVFVALHLFVKQLHIGREFRLFDFLKCLGELLLDLFDGLGVFLVVFLIEKVIDVLRVEALNPLLDDQRLVQHLYLLVLFEIAALSSDLFEI